MCASSYILIKTREASFSADGTKGSLRNGKKDDVRGSSLICVKKSTELVTNKYHHIDIICQHLPEQTWLENCMTGSRIYKTEAALVRFLLYPYLLH
jgi:hypothetical protein